MQLLYITCTCTCTYNYSNPSHFDWDSSIRRAISFLVTTRITFDTALILPLFSAVYGELCGCPATSDYFRSTKHSSVPIPSQDGKSYHEEISIVK